MALNNFRSVNLKIDKANDYFISNQFAKEGDYNGRKLVVQLTNGGLIQDQTGVALNLGWQHQKVGNKGLDPFVAVDSTQGIFEIAYPAEMMQTGNVVAVIQVIESGKIVETRNFTIQIEASPIDEDAIVSENSFTVLQEALITVNKYDGRIGTLESNKANKTEVAASFSEVTAQLAQKATKTDLETKRDKSAPINELDIADSLKQQINGNAPIVQTLADEVISARKTSFINSLNLFNKEAAVQGYLSSSGNVVTDATYKTSDYIKVKPGSTLHSSTLIGGYAFYDSGMNFLTATLGVAVTQISVISSAYYFRFYCTNSRSSIMMVTENRLPPTIYTPFKMILDTEYIGTLSRDGLGKVKINVDNLNFTTSKNLFDKTKASAGKYVNHDNGNIESNASYYVSDLIPVEPNSKYTRNVDRYTAFYDDDLIFISGHYDDTGNTKTLEVPNNGRYMICSLLTSEINTFQVEKGEFQTPYSEFGYKIKSSFIEGLEEVEPKTIDINLPNDLYVVNGKGLNLYFDTFIKDADKYNIDVDSSKGAQLKKKYSLTSDFTGDLLVTLNVYEGQKHITSKEITIKSVEQTNGTAVKKCIFIGDSVTNAGKYTQNLLDAFVDDTMGIELLGTRGVSPNLHEGRGGWSASVYTGMNSLSGVVNPFWNASTSRFDFNYYMTEQGYSGVDYVFINLGVNDIFNYKTVDEAKEKIPNILTTLNMMIDSVKDYNTDIKIALMMTIPPNQSQDAWGETYGTIQTQWRYYAVYQEWLKRFISEYENRVNEGIFLVPVHAQVDTLNHINDSVHPNDNGYMEISKPVYYFLKNLGD